MTKRINFFDGFTSETTPDTVIVSASGLIGTWQGDWVSQDYVKNDAVHYDGNAYICILDTTASQDPTDGTYWELAVQKGDVGPEGPQGPTGDTGPIGPSAAGISVRETPAGIVDGINADFTLSNTPTSEQYVSVFIDGNFQYDTEYSITTNVVTFNTAPALGQTVFVWYSHSGTPVSVPGVENIEYHTVSAGEETAKEFTLTSAPGDVAKVLVDIIGGVSQEYSVDFSITGSTFSWSGLGLDGILVENDIVRLKYFS